MALSYKGTSPQERDVMARKSKKALLEAGRPLKPLKCDRCGQTEGIIEYHNEDYSDPLKYLEALCYRCHMVVHCEYRAPDLCKKYWDEIKAGKHL